MNFMFSYSSAANYVPVELEWEQVTGAAQYILEIQTTKGVVVKTIKSKSANFRFKVKPGKYHVRSQVATAGGSLSPWSELSEMSVALPAPRLSEREGVRANKFIPDPMTMTARTSVEWEKVPDADHYRVQVIDKEGKIIAEKNLKEEKAEFELPVGEYKYKIQSVSAEGIESEPTLSNTPIIVQPARVAKPALENKPGSPLKWTSTAKALTMGTLEYSPHLSEEWTPVIEKKEMIGGVLNTKNLTPGRYRLHLWATAQGWTDSEIVSAEFVIKPMEKDLQM